MATFMEVLDTSIANVALRYIAGGLSAAAPDGFRSASPTTLAGVGLLLIAVSILAMFVPARRAMRVPPAVALNTG